MSEAGLIIRAQDLEPGALIEIEIEGRGTSIAKVQAVRDTIRGIEIDIFSNKQIPIPAGCAAVNYWTLRIPFDTRVHCSHLPSLASRDTSAAHAASHQQQWDPEPAQAG